MKHSALVAIAAILLASCSLNRPALVKQQYLLDPPTPAAVARSQSTSVRVGHESTSPHRFAAGSFVLREPTCVTRPTITTSFSSRRRRC